MQGGLPSCSCLSNYLGIPPNCRPECVINSDCTAGLACINEKCQDPCVGACGYQAECKVNQHIPNCACPAGYTGDPFTVCQAIPLRISTQRKTVFSILIRNFTLFFSNNCSRKIRIYVFFEIFR